MYLIFSILLLLNLFIGSVHWLLGCLTHYIIFYYFYRFKRIILLENSLYVSELKAKFDIFILDLELLLYFIGLSFEVQ